MFLDKFNSSAILFFSFYYLLKTRLDFIFLSFNDLVKPIELGSSKWTRKDINRFCRYIEKLSKICGIKSCFVKSIAKRNFLNKKGYVCEMYIGVTLKNKFESHSWLISDGINCYETPDKKMKVLKIIK